MGVKKRFNSPQKAIPPKENLGECTKDIKVRSRVWDFIFYLCLARFVGLDLKFVWDPETGGRGSAMRNYEFRPGS